MDLFHETRVDIPEIGAKLHVVDVRSKVDRRRVWPAAKYLWVRNASLRVARRNVALWITCESDLGEELLAAANRVVEKLVTFLHVVWELVAREAH